MKQANSKNSRIVNWPTTTYFTFDDLHQLNLSFDKKITLRVRLTNAIEEGKVVEIGSIPGGQGRPPKVYVLSPVTQIALDKAEANGITVPGEAKKLINIVTVNHPVSTFSNIPVTV
jgi:hypothetical protein